MANYITSEELKKFAADLENYVKTSLENEEVAFAGVVKEYVEAQLAALENKLVNSDKWEQVKTAVESLIEVFDANEDGQLTAQEILTKIGEITGQINALADRLSTLEKKVDDSVSNLQGQISSNATEIANLKTTAQNLDKKIEDTKAEIESEINSVVDTKVSAAKEEVSTAMVDAFKGIEDAMTAAYQAAQNTIQDRMAKVRAVFGLEVTTSTTDNSSTTDNGSSANTPSGDAL